MKVITSSLIVAILIFTGCSKQTKEKDISHMTAVTVRIATTNVMGETGYGSGVYIAPQFIVTANHVVDDSTGPIIIMVNGLTAIKISGDPKLDLALLKVFKDHSEYATIGDEPSLYQECVSFSYQCAFETPTLTKGLIQDNNHFIPSRELSYMRYSANGWFGCSGGGVFVHNKDGKLVLISISQRIYAPSVHQVLGAQTKNLQYFVNSCLCYIK